MIGDPTEGALVVAAAKVGLWQNELAEDWPARGRDSIRHRPQADDHDPRGQRRSGRSSPMSRALRMCMLDLCSYILEGEDERPLTLADRHRILEMNQELTGEALRVLAVTYRNLYEVPQTSRRPMRSSATWCSSA